MSNGAATYSIKDLEHLSTIQSHTIRIWEKRYALLSPQRSNTNIRCYSTDDLKKLLNVSFLNKQGVKISAIAKMSEKEIEQRVLSLNLNLTDNEHLIDNLITSLIDLNEIQFQKILNTVISRSGFEHTISHLLFPFFERIGIMWQTGVINPAQEHFVSNIVRNKIIAATDNIDYQPTINKTKIVMLLPETELHEISLLFYNYALRKRGYVTLYLGQIVPINSIERIVEITQADVLICTMTSSINAKNTNEMLQLLSNAFPKKILISGPAIKNYQGALPSNVFRFEDVNNMLQLVQK